MIDLDIVWSTEPCTLLHDANNETPSGLIGSFLQETDGKLVCKSFLSPPKRRASMSSVEMELASCIRDDISVARRDLKWSNMAISVH
jgi:hypothetical protein